MKCTLTQANLESEKTAAQDIEEENPGFIVDLQNGCFHLAALWRVRNQLYKKDPSIPMIHLHWKSLVYARKFLILVKFSGNLEAYHLLGLVRLEVIRSLNQVKNMTLEDYEEVLENEQIDMKICKTFIIGKSTDLINHHWIFLL